MPAEQNYKLTPAQLEAAIKPTTKLLLFNNPSNPTGMIYTPDEVSALADVLVRHPLWVLSDDIYNRMIFDGLPYAHLVKARPELRDRVVLIDSISKTYGMPGWRVGLIAGPESVAQAMVTLNSNHITSLPEVNHGSPPPPRLPGRRRCRSRVHRLLAASRPGHRRAERDPRRALPETARCVLCLSGHFVAFGRRHGSNAIADDVDFCNALLDAKGVACVPGSAFGEPKAIRISYTCKPAELTDGLKRMQEFFAELK